MKQQDRGTTSRRSNYTRRGEQSHYRDSNGNSGRRSEYNRESDQHYGTPYRPARYSDPDENYYTGRSPENEQNYTPQGRSQNYRREEHNWSDRTGTRNRGYGRQNEDSSYTSMGRDEQGRFTSPYEQQDTDWPEGNRRTTTIGDEASESNWNENSEYNQQGSHRGKGPKGYKRTDERIKEQVNEILTDDEYLDASEIEVEVKDGEVTLSGSVSNRDDKRRAEDLIESVSGINNIENRIRVGNQSTSNKNTSEESEKSKSKSKSHGGL